MNEVAERPTGQLGANGVESKDGCRLRTAGSDGDFKSSMVIDAESGRGHAGM